MEHHTLDNDNQEEAIHLPPDEFFSTRVTDKDDAQTILQRTPQSSQTASESSTTLPSPELTDDLRYPLQEDYPIRPVPNTIPNLQPQPYEPTISHHGHYSSAREDSWPTWEPEASSFPSYGSERREGMPSWNASPQSSSPRAKVPFRKTTSTLTTPPVTSSSYWEWMEFWTRPSMAILWTLIAIVVIQHLQDPFRRLTWQVTSSGVPWYEVLWTWCMELLQSLYGQLQSIQEWMRRLILHPASTIKSSRMWMTLRDNSPFYLHDDEDDWMTATLGMEHEDNDDRQDMGRFYNKNNQKDSFLFGSSSSSSSILGGGDPLPRLELVVSNQESTLVSETIVTEAALNDDDESDASSLPPAFLSDEEYPTGWLVYHSILGVVTKAEADQYDQEQIEQQHQPVPDEVNDNTNEQEQDPQNEEKEKALHDQRQQEHTQSQPLNEPSTFPHKETDSTNTTETLPCAVQPSGPVETIREKLEKENKEYQKSSPVDDTAAGPTSAPMTLEEGIGRSAIERDANGPREGNSDVIATKVQDQLKESSQGAISDESLSNQNPVDSSFVNNAVESAAGPCHSVSPIKKLEDVTTCPPESAPTSNTVDDLTSRSAARSHNSCNTCVEPPHETPPLPSSSSSTLSQTPSSPSSTTSSPSSSPKNTNSLTLTVALPSIAAAHG